ncbi:MAG TPA: hypothetical protein PK812_04635 [Beijerinckiaceae bacterium]|nr:hypothetical protein [Beijerinckiaceae bacterium]
MIQQNAKSDGPGDASQMTARVTTIISCPGVVPLAQSGTVVRPNANENHWYDRIGLRKRRYANLAGLAVVLALLFAGVWIMQEFVRLQKVAACYEAGRRDCASLSMERRGR